MEESEFKCIGCGRSPRDCNILPCLQVEAILSAEPSTENAEKLEAMWPGTVVTPKNRE